jgi:hypothetical protein
MREALALLVPTLAVGVCLFPQGSPTTRNLVWAATSAMCLGIGFSSVTSTALIALGISPATTPFVLADVAIWAIVAGLGWWVKPPSRVPTAAIARAACQPSGHIDLFFRAAFATTVIVALVSVIVSSLIRPHGNWDAWAIWNQHARFLFRAGGSDLWRAMFAIEWSHPDYPLLLPASVARTWAYAGQETTLGPAMIATVLGMASVAFVVTALDGRRAWIAGALIVCGSMFLAQIPSQCADVPLACFIVATLAAAWGRQGIRLQQESPRMSAMVAGASCAMAAWTKNEGLLFAVLLLMWAAVAAVRHRATGRLLWNIAGAAPVVIAIVWFKMTLAPTTDLLVGQSLQDYLDRLRDLHRHETVVRLMAAHLISWGAPVAVAIFPLMGLAAAGLAFRGGSTARSMTAVIGLMLLSYYMVYLTTPREIAWHISTSFDRLLVQLWPALVLTVSLGSYTREASNYLHNQRSTAVRRWSL